MTGTELILALKLQLNQLDTGSNKTLYTEVALDFLNKAYKELVRAKYSADVPNDDYFGKNQKVDDELNHLVMTHTFGGQGKVFSKSIDAIDRYFFYLDTENMEVAGNSIIELAIKPVGKNSVTKHDPFSKAENLYPTVTFANNSIVYEIGDASLLSGNIIYLALPNTITTTSNCIAPFTDEIIDTATVMILESWKDERVSSKIPIDQAIKNN